LWKMRDARTARLTIVSDGSAPVNSLQRNAFGMSGEIGADASQP
jgi:hypothetical protein